MKAIVIYRSVDADGIFCCEIARKFLPDADFIGWNFGDPPVCVAANGLIYIMGLPPTCIVEQDFHNFWRRVVWIDGNAETMEWDKRPVASDAPDVFISGYRIEGIESCRLAWQWFNGGKLRDLDEIRASLKIS